jgi:hypothetical protein
MPIDEYMKTHRGRHWFVSKTVMEQAQQVLQIIICPKCIKEVRHGIEGTQFFTTVEDDVMTVFPAMGHFICHYCGFEEYHPLKSDPRVRFAFAGDTNTGVYRSNTIGSAGMANQLGVGIAQSATEARVRAQAAQANMEQVRQAYQAGMVGVADAAKQMHEAIGRGIDPGMGPIWGMTEDERRSLHRLYQRSKKEKPPEIIESKEEASRVAAMPAIERRQWIIQKMRDKGFI